MLGLVLGGGGSKGAFQVGAYRALLECGYEFDGVVGASIGALNAAMIAQEDYEKLYEIWRSIDLVKVLGNEDLAEYIQHELLEDDSKTKMDELFALIKWGKIDAEPALHFIENAIDEEKLRASKMDFGLVTCNLTDRKIDKLFKADIPKGRIAEYLMASSYLPVFKFERIDGKFFADGGFYDNLPFQMLLDRGYDEIVTIKIGGVGRERPIPYNEAHFIEIKNRQDTGYTMNFTRENSIELITRGYLDTMVQLGHLIGNEYSFTGMKKDFVEIFETVSEDKIERLLRLFNVETSNNRASFYMYVLPEFAKLLNLDHPSEEDLALTITERAMKTCNYSLTKAYDPNAVIGELKDKRVFPKNEPEGAIDRIKNFITKESVLDEAVEILFS